MIFLGLWFLVVQGLADMRDAIGTLEKAKQKQKVTLERQRDKLDVLQRENLRLKAKERELEELKAMVRKMRVLDPDDVCCPITMDVPEAPMLCLVDGTFNMRSTRSPGRSMGSAAYVCLLCSTIDCVFHHGFTALF